MLNYPSKEIINLNFRVDYGVSFTIYQAKMLVDHILEIIQLGELDKGSINRPEVFAKKNIPNLNPECVANFRDIRNLRSQKMPIHEDHPRLMQILEKGGFKIPINWGDLWEMALTKYRDSLEMIKEAIQ